VDKKVNEFIKEFYELHPNRKILFLFKAGSHFFDLNSANSDSDYRGVYMPSLEEFYKGESKRRFFERKTAKGNMIGIKNTKDDVDFYLFSITFFLDLLKKGDFNCMEALFCPKDKILIDSDEINELINIKNNLLVNDISAFLGFIKKEYRHYGININHYGDQLNFIKFLDKYPRHITLKDLWPDVIRYSQDDTAILLTTSHTGHRVEVPSIKIAQRIYQWTVHISYIIKSIENTLNKYGHRQIQQAETGCSYKGLYHALRLIYEVNDLLDYEELKIPFDPVRYDILKSIKESSVDKNYIFNLIDSELSRLLMKEKSIETNKHIVEYRIDKILFNLTSKKKIEYILYQK
jgi:hypothetical protein